MEMDSSDEMKSTTHRFHSAVLKRKNRKLTDGSERPFLTETRVEEGVKHIERQTFKFGFDFCCYLALI